MSGQVIQRGKLGDLTKIGQGGQGVVFAAPNVTTKFAASMVYKEYKTQALAGIDFTALAAMPALVEDALSYNEAERLIALAAWPCAIVHDGGSPSGFVMPVIPERFFVELTTVKGTSSVTAEFQHLLNHPSVLAARGTTVDDAQRYALLREAASGLAFMHKHGVCIGDISPKNLLYSLVPREAVYLIDCDAMRVNGVSALEQVETPGWQVPSGEELATVYSDTYKLGLLALRLLAGDHDTVNPGHLPASTPGLLRQLITDTVTKPPHQRPLPEAWTYVLGHAIEEAQHLNLAAPTAPTVAAPPPPQTPTVYSRPSGKSAGRSQPAPKAAPPPQPIPYSAPPPASPWASPKKSSSPTLAIVGVGVAIVIAIIAGAIIIGKNLGGSADTSASTTGYTTTRNSPYSSAPTYGPTYATVPSRATATAAALIPPPDLLQSPDLTGDSSCVGGKPIPNHPGGRAGPGSPKTSCLFASNVSQAYWASNPSSSAIQRVVAPGAVGCMGVRAEAPNVECQGNSFVMQCGIYGSDRWITCTGGNEARVYIF